MKPSTKKLFRTILQTLIGLAAALPLIVTASGVPETVPGVGVALAVSGAITRIMAIPAVNDLLPPFLRLDELDK